MKKSAIPLCAAVAFMALATLTAAVGEIPPVGREFVPEFQQGVCFTHNRGEGRGYGTGEAAASLAEIRALGANAVTLIPIGYSFNIRHPEIFGYRGEDLTLTRDLLVASIHEAHRQGLKVCLNPHLWIGLQVAEGAAWRGKVAMTTPQDWARWFAEYESFILYFARIAQETGVELFCVGSELEGTTTPEHTAEWQSVIRKVRSVYTGPCTYSANWSGEFERIGFWNELEYVGLSAYFPLEGERREEQMAAAVAVRERLKVFHRTINKPILFLESGFQSQSRVAGHPSFWQWNSREPSNLKEQEALFDLWSGTFWNEPWFYGIYWWNWHSDRSYATPTDNTYSFRGKPAQEVVRHWFATPPRGSAP